MSCRRQVVVQALGAPGNHASGNVNVDGRLCQPVEEKVCHYHYLNSAFSQTFIGASCAGQGPSLNILFTNMLNLINFTPLKLSLGERQTEKNITEDTC